MKYSELKLMNLY